MCGGDVCTCVHAHTKRSEIIQDNLFKSNSRNEKKWQRSREVYLHYAMGTDLSFLIKIKLSMIQKCSQGEDIIAPRIKREQITGYLKQ